MTNQWQVSSPSFDRFRRVRRPEGVVHAIKWAVQRARYITLEGIAPISEPHRQPASRGRLTSPAKPVSW
jgi:hypothetical protein